MPFRHRAFGAVLVSVSGLAVIFAMGASLRGNDLGLILSAGGGALIGGTLCAGLFGQPGQRGLALAALGAVLATLIGAAVAGLGFGLVVGPTLAGILYGPLTVAHAIATMPVVLLAWTATMVGAHLTLGALSDGSGLPS
jgi:hypothetical protein